METEERVVGFILGVLFLLAIVILVFLTWASAHDALKCKKITGFYECKVTDNNQGKVMIEVQK